MNSSCIGHRIIFLEMIGKVSMPFILRGGLFSIV